MTPPTPGTSHVMNFSCLDFLPLRHRWGNGLEWVCDDDVITQQDLGITGLQMVGVKRLENRFLYNRFNVKLENILEQPSYSKMLHQRSYKQFLDYLFLVWSPGMCM